MPRISVVNKDTAKEKNWITDIPNYEPPPIIDYKEPTYNHNNDQLVWIPNLVDDNELDEFIAVAKETNDWTLDQSHCFLHAFDYDIKKALKNLAIFRTVRSKPFDRCQQISMQHMMIHDNRIKTNRFPNHYELVKFLICDNHESLIRKDIISEILKSEIEYDEILKREQAIRELAQKQQQMIKNKKKMRKIKDK
ncbi:hypothetical protein DERF_005647 [Dermatophagoides farinae]|nr:hypothetical protein DERF_005647 [Dermatophagoides farinae]